MTWVEWIYYKVGLLKKRNLEWEHTRSIAWMIYKANSDPKKSAKNMQTWWRLPTDEGFATRSNRVKGKRLTEAKKLEFFKSMR